MKEKEAVVKYFELCRVENECSIDCPYWDNNGGARECTKELAKDVLTLLKGQEPVEPRMEDDGTPEPGTCWWYVCGSCGGDIGSQDRFCCHCGREVKWE